jgi:hypothetical protein
MRIRKALSFLSVFVPLALGDVSFTTPSTAGDSFPGGSPFTVKWADSGVAPSISDLTTYQLALYTSSNAAPVSITPVFWPTFNNRTITDVDELGTVVDAGPRNNRNWNSLSYTCSWGWWEHAKCLVYHPTAPNTGQQDIKLMGHSFLQMTSVKADGGSVINYSSRFTLTGMTGTFTPDVIAGLETVTGTTGPPAQLIAAAGGAAAGTGADGQFGIPYNQQTGLTKYAPMQPLPPTSITQQNISPLWPTSSVPIATTFLPVPSVQTTVTQNPTYVFTSHENTVCTLRWHEEQAADPHEGCSTISTYWRHAKISQPMERLSLAPRKLLYLRISCATGHRKSLSSGFWALVGLIMDL